MISSLVDAIGPRAFAGSEAALGLTLAEVLDGFAVADLDAFVDPAYRQDFEGAIALAAAIKQLHQTDEPYEGAR